MNKKKLLCRLSLNYYGSSWVEARHFESGFTVALWDEDVIPTPTTIGSLQKKYSWKLFCHFLMKMSDGFVTTDALQSIDVTGESGLRADCLRIAWSYSFDGGSRVLDLLLCTDELSFRFIESAFEIINKPEDFELLEHLSELLLTQNVDTNIVNLLRSFELEIKRDSVEELIQRLEYREEIKNEQKARIREQKIQPFNERIVEISTLFSNERRRIGCGMSGGRPSLREIVRRWLENYVVDHGYLPEGSHKVSIPFFGGSTTAGTIDFSNLSEKSNSR